MQRSVSSIRSVLAGFCGLLLMMACLTVDSALQTNSVSITSTALRKESRERDAILDQLRNDTYRSATLARDYLLEQDDTVAMNQRAELQSLNAHVEQELDRYSKIAPPEEQKVIRTLQQHAKSYWASVAPALDWDRTTRREHGEAFLRSTMVPNRDELLQFVNQVTGLAERALDAGEGRIQVLQSSFQRRVRTISILALILGGILAIIVVRHAQHVGAQAEQRFNEVLSAREDLRRLSDRLLEVQEEERRRLSRELHDDLGQTMSAMLIEFGKLESILPGHEGHHDEWTAVKRLAEENVAKVRNMALLLRPAMLDELGLVPALRWQAREVSRRTGLKVKMVADDLTDDLLNDDLPDSSRTCIYRIVQEALNNCVKHSKAKEVRVVIQREGEGLSVSVRDDGIGFEPENNKGLGLLGMMERVSGLGGRFHIDSRPGRGTVISVSLPLQVGRHETQQETIV